jgi:membrane fusion protein, multidrug efflux system
MQGKKKAPWLAIALVVAAAGGGVAWYWAVNLRGFVSSEDARIDGRSVVVSAKSVGRISAMAVDQGDRVSAGQVVIRLDDTDLQAQERLAAAGVVSAEKATVLARVNLERARADFDRAAQLWGQKNISQENYEHARSAASAAAAQLDVALAQADAARAQLGVIATQLANAVLASPVNGIVARRWISQGEVVQAAQAILTINDLDDLWVSANFEETRLARLRVGAPVAIHVDAYPGLRLTGRIVSLGSATASQFSLIPSGSGAGNFTKITQRVPVRIGIDRGTTDAMLVPGLSVVVKVTAP